jgi:beta-lactam-binding protein with PASTA domain
MGFLGFLGKKKFYISLLSAIIISLFIVFISFQVIKSYTRHGKALVLPDFTGMTLQDIENYNYGDIFDFIITDSIYTDNSPPGSVIKQNPSPHSKVKRGRNVYITVVAMNPEMTIMPDLKDLTVRQALSMLKAHGLKVRKLRFVQDMADNAVLGHFFDGDTLMSGDILQSGSEIDLLIGRSNNIPGPVPFLIGKEEQDATDMIITSSYNVGRIRYWDSLARKDGKVYQQRPMWTEELQKGEKMSIWLRSVTQFNFDSLVESLMPDTLEVDDQQSFPGDSVIIE